MAASYFRKYAAGAVLGAALALGTVSSSLAADTSVFQSIIKNQMSAFAADDAKTAFSFATKSLQQRFQTPEFFMQMVRSGYQPVYRPRDVTFGQSKITKFGPTQEVYVTGPKGQNWLALYSFEEQEDGSWRISGCYLTKSEGFAA